MAANLFEQMGEQQISAMCAVMGFDKVDAGFRNFLREIKPLEGDFTITDAINAYVEKLESILKPKFKTTKADLLDSLEERITTVEALTKHSDVMSMAEVVQILVQIKKDVQAL
jgi:hypothetical protein